MRSFWTVITLAVAAIVIVSTPSAARKADISNVKRIGIVAAMGNTLELRQVGFTVFGNSAGTTDISDWKIDDEIAATAATALKGRFDTVVIANVDTARFRPDGPGFFGAQIDEDDETKALAARVGAPPVDAYLLIYPLFNTNPISLNNQWLTGPGLYRESSSEAVYCLGIAALVDARTFETIERKWLELKSDDRVTGSDLPFRRVQGVVPEDFNTMTPEQKRQAETVMKEILREATEQTLVKLGLTP